MPWCCDVTAIQDELQGKAVERITFKEVTQKAVERALASPRQIDSHLVDAYMARRALDYLMGYNISPTLMRKVGAARSAGMNLIPSKPAVPWSCSTLHCACDTAKATVNDATPAVHMLLI